MINSNTMVHVRITGSDAGQGKSISVVEDLSLAQLGVDADDDANAPRYPQEEIAAINTTPGLKATDRAKQITAIVAQYEADKAAHAAAGGATVQERIAAGVASWLLSAKNFANKPVDDGRPFVDVSNLMVAGPSVVGGVTSFTATAQPVWG